ncbi:MAG: hypothetical protein KC731_41260 [Myxococcales bacterium]|nr:hypothetical protein [Myxococcales bacterium]
MMLIRVDQLLALRDAALAERRRELESALIREGIDEASEVTQAVSDGALVLGLRGRDDDLRLARLVVAARRAPDFASWREEMFAVLERGTAPIEDRLGLIEREILPRMQARKET